MTVLRAMGRDGVNELPPPVLLNGTDVTAFPLVRDDMVMLVRKHGSLYEWAATQPQSKALRGRGPVYVVTLPISGVNVVVRHAWHGGLLAPLTGDRFRYPSRAAREMKYSEALRRAGVPTTSVLGFVRHKAGPGLVRVDVVTHYVPDAADFGMVVAGLGADVECDEALEATRRLLVHLAVLGIVHPDLNVKNVLLHRSGSGAAEAMIIDVDTIRWDPSRTPGDTMRRNLARLTRSIRKWRRRFGCELDEDRIDEFIRAASADLGRDRSGS